MFKSEIAHKYFTCYYSIGDIAVRNNKINITTVYDYYNFYLSLKDALNTFFYGRPNDIPFTFNFANIAAVFIGEYLYNTNDLTQEEELMLHSIENDLELFIEMT